MYRSVNPATAEVLKEFEFSAYPDPDLHLQAFKTWKSLRIEERAFFFEKLTALLEERRDSLARLISLEMGKPLAESLFEIDKVAGTIRYYTSKSGEWLKPEKVEIGSSEAYVSFEPLGVIVSIMPWNFPFWQVFRCAVPVILAGNVMMLKHAPNVPQCARAIGQLFEDAGFPQGVFTNYFLSNEDAAKLIADPRTAGLSFTGSEATGSYLASLAGKHIKKVVMELGGNDPLLVMEDASIDDAVAAAVQSRCINGGQACNGAKRFIVVKAIAEEFTRKLIRSVSDLKTGDPFDPQTKIGPMARPDLAEKVRHQIRLTVEAGAQLHEGLLAPSGKNFVTPVVLTNVRPGSCAFEEEVFGPVWSVTIAEDEEDAITLANRSRFGLGASLWTNNRQRANRIIPQLETGNVFVNDIVRSDARLPFGGVKHSGYGRELSKYGMMEFVNIKTVVIK